MRALVRRQADARARRGPDRAPPDQRDDAGVAIQPRAARSLICRRSARRPPNTASHPQPDLNCRAADSRDVLRSRRIRAGIRSRRRRCSAALEEALDELNGVREREAAEMIAVMLRHNGCDSPRRPPNWMQIRHAPCRCSRPGSPSGFGTCSRAVQSIRSGWPRRSRCWRTAATSARRSPGWRSTPGNWRRCSKGGGEIGKKLDFLLQEMNRETNTILSKTTGVGELGLRITELALAAKAEIEKIREQCSEPRMSITVFIISAPSGSGKSTLVKGLLETVPGLRFSVSYTTRAPRGQRNARRELLFHLARPI